MIKKKKKKKNFQKKDAKGLKVKGWKKIHHAIINPKKAIFIVIMQSRFQCNKYNQGQRKSFHSDKGMDSQRGQQLKIFMHLMTELHNT